MNKYLSTPMAQAVLAALGRGVVMALLAYFGMLVKHVGDRDTIIGVVGITLLIPLAGLLHLTVPSLPVAMQARLFPRIGDRNVQPTPDPQRQPPPHQEWTQPLPNPPTTEVAPPAQRDQPAMYVDPHSPYLARDAAPPYTQKRGWQQPPQR